VIEKPAVYVDPALKRIMDDRLKAVAPSDEIRQRLAALRGRA